MPIKPFSASLPAFESLVQGAGLAARNCVNQAELSSLIDQTLQSRLEDSELPRALKCRAWMRSVARKWVLREGAVAGYQPSAQELESAPEWARAIALHCPEPEARALMAAYSVDATQVFGGGEAWAPPPRASEGDVSSRG